jgi:plasmid maintenance system antidote protein VapI
MADEHAAALDPKAQRVAQWLAENRTEFEERGIGEDKLAEALGIDSGSITEAVDHLEAREEVVRIPQGLGTPPQFKLKPGRGWPEARDAILGGA